MAGNGTTRLNALSKVMMPDRISAQLLRLLNSLPTASGSIKQSKQQTGPILLKGPGLPHSLRMFLLFISQTDGMDRTLKLVLYSLKLAAVVSSKFSWLRWFQWIRSFRPKLDDNDSEHDDNDRDNYNDAQGIAMDEDLGNSDLEDFDFGNIHLDLEEFFGDDMSFYTSRLARRLLRVVPMINETRKVLRWGGTLSTYASLVDPAASTSVQNISYDCGSRCSSEDDDEEEADKAAEERNLQDIGVDEESISSDSSDDNIALNTRIRDSRNTSNNLSATAANKRTKSYKAPNTSIPATNSRLLHAIRTWQKLLLLAYYPLELIELLARRRVIWFHPPMTLTPPLGRRRGMKRNDFVGAGIVRTSKKEQQQRQQRQRWLPDVEVSRDLMTVKGYTALCAGNCTRLSKMTPIE